jgi:hypothetical protein
MTVTAAEKYTNTIYQPRHHPTATLPAVIAGLLSTVDDLDRVSLTLSHRIRTDLRPINSG